MVQEYAKHFFADLFEIFNEMSPYLMLGFIFAGLLHVFFPKQKVSRYMGRKNRNSVINASLIGVPLPLCSCGVIPTGISFYKHGASRGSTVSFLISTPQTGIDSILVTYSLLGLPFALIRPIVAFFSGVIGGIFTNFNTKNEKEEEVDDTDDKKETLSRVEKTREMFRYAFVEFLQDISNWLIIGLVLAAIVSVIVPPDFFATHLGNGFLGKIIILIAAIPVYVCATASVPIAAVLMIKGLSPGAALVFLMAGPATNVATITMIGKVLGKRSLFSYLISIIGGALIFGTLIDWFLPSSWFTLNALSETSPHQHETLPYWLKISSSVLLIILIINGYIQKFLDSKKMKTVNIHENKNEKSMISKSIKVQGMTCNHCKANVENAIKSIEGVDDVQIDLSSGKVIISGDSIELDQVKTNIESVGYEFKGEI